MPFHRKFCIQHRFKVNFVYNTISKKNLIQHPFKEILYTICIQSPCKENVAYKKKIFDRVLLAKLSLAGRCIQNFHWMVRCIQNFLWKGIVYKTFFENWHLSIFKLFIAIFYVSKITKFLCLARIQESQELFAGLPVWTMSKLWPNFSFEGFSYYFYFQTYKSPPPVTTTTCLSRMNISHMLSQLVRIELCNLSP